MQLKDFMSLLYYLSEDENSILKTDVLGDSWIEIKLTPSGFISCALKNNPTTQVPMILTTSPLVLKDHIWKKNEWKVAPKT